MVHVTWSKNHFRELGAVTRSARVDWESSATTIGELEDKCRDSWEFLRVLKQQDNFTNDLKNKLTSFVQEAAQHTMIIQTVWKRLQVRHRKNLRWFGISDFSAWPVKCKRSILRSLIKFVSSCLLYNFRFCPGIQNRPSESY